METRTRLRPWDHNDQCQASSQVPVPGWVNSHPRDTVDDLETTPATTFDSWQNLSLTNTLKTSMLRQGMRKRLNRHAIPRAVTSRPVQWTGIGLWKRNLPGRLEIIGGWMVSVAKRSAVPRDQRSGIIQRKPIFLLFPLVFFDSWSNDGLDVSFERFSTVREEDTKMDH